MEERDEEGETEEREVFILVVAPRLQVTFVCC